MSVEFFCRALARTLQTSSPIWFPAAWAWHVAGKSIVLRGQVFPLAGNRDFQREPRFPAESGISAGNRARGPQLQMGLQSMALYGPRNPKEERMGFSSNRLQPPDLAPDRLSNHWQPMAQPLVQTPAPAKATPGAPLPTPSRRRGQGLLGLWALRVST